MRKLLVPLAAASLLAFSGCGTFDVSEAESQMQEGWDKALGVSGTKVECPDDIDLKNGEKATCNVTLPDGSKRTSALEVTDESDGKFTYEVPTG